MSQSYCRRVEVYVNDHESQELILRIYVSKRHPSKALLKELHAPKNMCCLERQLNILAILNYIWSNHLKLKGDER